MDLMTLQVSFKPVLGRREIAFMVPKVQKKCYKPRPGQAEQTDFSRKQAQLVWHMAAPSSQRKSRSQIPLGD